MELLLEQKVDMPVGWKRIPLGAVIETKPGNNKLIKGKQFDEPGPSRYPGFSATGQDIYCAVAEYDRDGIVLSAVGARCGKCFMATGKWTAVANTHVLLPKLDEVDTKFIWYLLNDENFWVKSGTAQPFVAVKKSMEIEVALPPIPQQRRIVEAIELQLGRLDAAVARLQGAKARLKRYKQAVLKAAVEGRLFNTELSDGELPDDWTWTTLGEAVELVSGGTPKGLNESETGGNIPFFKVGDMTLDGNERYMETSRTYLTPAEAKRLKLTIHPAGTVIFPKRGGAILTNKKRVLSGPGAFDLNLMGAIPNDEIDGDFLFYWFEQLDLSKIYDGSNIPQINKKNVDPLPFAKPPLKEQRRIADELDRLLSSSDETEATLNAQLQQAVRLRQAVLKRAFEGRLV